MTEQLDRRSLVKTSLGLTAGAAALAAALPGGALA